MNLTLHRSDDFLQDFDLQYRWYLDKAGMAVAEKFQRAVLVTLQLLSTHPGLGRKRNFPNPRLRDLRSFRLISPFGVHLIFYRHTLAELFAERLMHGARDLPHRLAEPPASAS